MPKQFNGWHMTAILVCFFGVIVIVNFTMASYATRTFGGTVVDNSYVASQRYNDWLAAAREQDSLQWSETVGRDGTGVRIELEAPDGMLEGAIVTAIAEHPLGRSEPTTLAFVEGEPGIYHSREPVADGRWVLRIEIESGADRKRLLADLS